MQAKNVMISQTVVGSDAAPYIIAEAGSNFNQDLDTARKMIDVASESGANAVKFQLFRAEFLYPDGGELHDIFKSIELNPSWVPKLVEYAAERNIHFMASAFDTISLDILENVDVPAHKIASSEVTNLRYLHYVASTGKPVIISTGMCDMIDVEKAVDICKQAGNENIILMQCGALYPLPSEQANLRVIQTFMDRFGCPAGFSDHTLGATASIAAVGLGANIFEKHFTLDRNSKGPDHFYAIEPDELKSYVENLHEAYRSLGRREKFMLPKEKEVGRREGIYFARDMVEGELITVEDVEIKRPALGLRDRYLSEVIGTRVASFCSAGAPLTWQDLNFKR